MANSPNPVSTPPRWPLAVIAILAVALVVTIFSNARLRRELAEAEAELAAGAAAAPPLGAPAAAAPAPTMVPAAAVFSEAQKQAMMASLQSETDPARKAWLQIQRGNPETEPMAEALRQVFEQAGWPVEVSRTPYALKAGVFLMAGDTDPPAYVGTVEAALKAAGLEPQFLTGYREFVAERKSTNPNWVGPELAAEQTYAIIIGPRPKT
jgi:hypothetical protein